jgi:peptidoglycan hydrolase CwlO-like protein
MRKKIVAFVVAFVLTGIIAAAMLVVGVSAAFNKNGVAVSNSPAQAALQSSTNLTGDPAQQIAQLQNMVSQYQAQLQSAQTQLNQANQQMQTVNQLIAFLEQRGIISIDNQGNIIVNVRGGRDDGFGG